MLRRLGSRAVLGDACCLSFNVSPAKSGLQWLLAFMKIGSESSEKLNPHSTSATIGATKYS